MGRNVYQFFLTNVADHMQVRNCLLAQGYSLVKHNDTKGIFLEKELPYGIIEANLNEYESNYRYSIRIAKPNSEETVSVLLKDVIEMRKQFPNLILYDMETKESVDLNDEKTLIKKFLKAKEEFFIYFSVTANKAPIRGDDVFGKK